MKPQKLVLLHSIPYTLLLIMLLETKSQILALQNSTISVALVFGDSTVDPGNNNYIHTIFKSNYPPYGREFPNQIPTGRFSDGRLITDYIASYLGIKEFVPPYLDSTLSIKELMTGVSFASAGSGLDPLTPQLLSVIPISNQLEYFREYKRKLEMEIGKQKSLELIKRAGFIISAGTNDFVISYFATQIRQNTYSVTSYQHFLFQQLMHLIQDLEEEGAQKIVIVGLPPMGCLPVVITLFGDILHDSGRTCIESLSSVAKDYNAFLQKQLSTKQNYGSIVNYVDIYTPLNNIIIQGRKLGFDVVNQGCCGSGLVEAGFLCNPRSIVCPNASKYIFWDAIHPTQKAYYTIFESLIPTIDRIAKL